jgi:hypothetical protein
MIEDVKNKQLIPPFLDSSQELSALKSEMTQAFDEQLSLKKDEGKAVSPYMKKSVMRLRCRLKAGRGIF